MIRSVIFVTTELAPHTPGGAGVLVASLASRLTAASVDVRVLLVADAEGDLASVAHDVEVLREAAPTTAQGFWDRSERVAERLGHLLATSPADLVEVQDFDALALVPLLRRHAAGLTDTRVVVRFHGPADLQVEATGVVPAELEPVRSAERSVFGMADGVIVPSAGIGELVGDRYGVDPERLIVGTPPVAALDGPPRAPSPSPELVVVGRLGEVKGSHDLVNAAIPVLEEHRSAVVRFIGNDGWSASTGQPMSTWLRHMIPTPLADRIRFEGGHSRRELAEALASAWALVVASRFESFCLAAHEARGYGLPVIVPDLPAFSGILTEATGALVYPAGTTGLQSALNRFLSDAALRSRLEAAPAPGLPDPLAPYADPLPTPRHPQAQAGLATAAANSWEEAVAALTPASGAVRWIARGLLRWLPQPVARAAVRLLPQGVKDRFRGVASWPAEQARRRVGARRARIERWIRDGRFPEQDEPRFSVVVPVFNDAQYLMEALVSVFDSSGTPDFEVIVVDDGSTDPDTLAVLEAIDWPRVTVIRQENTGLPGARNTGIRAASGEYIVPLDSDDLLAPGYLNRLASALDEHPEAAFAHCWARLFGDIDRLWQTRPYNPYQLLLSNSVVGCVMMRRSAWDAVGGYDETMTDGNEDWELWIRFMEAGFGQVQVPEPLFHYRKHGTSMSVETEARFEEGRREIVVRHRELYEPAALAEFKRKHYPLVSLIVGRDVSAPDGLDDVEVVVRTGDLASAVRSSHGKYIVEWDGTEAAAGALAAMAAALEAAPEAAAVKPRRHAGPVVMRRWVLFDAEAAPQGTIEIDVDASGPAGSLERGMASQPIWRTIRGDVETQRQRPEEEGAVPAWIHQL